MANIQVNNDLHSQFSRAQAFMPPQLLGILAILKFLFEESLCWFTRPVEVFLHRRFGVRGHSLFQTIQVCVVGASIASTYGRLDLFFGIFSLAAAVLAVIHRIEAVRHEKYGKAPRHSYSNGEPIPIWAWVFRALGLGGGKANHVIDISTVCRYYEPALVLVLGIVLSFISPPLGYYLACCAVAIFVRNLLVHMRLLNMKRDFSDAKLMAGWLASVNKEGAATDEAEYFVVQLAEVGNGGAGAPPEPQASVETGIVADEVLGFTCCNCNAPFHVQRRHCGRKGRCKSCKTLQLIPALS